MRLEIDIPEHQYNNIMAIKSINIGRAPYKGIVMYAINAIKLGKVLEQEPRKDEVIFTNKEYRELMANEYDHGYCKGYAEALEEQESTDKKFTNADIDAIVKAINAHWELIIDEIRAEIEQLSTSTCTETRKIYIDADDFKENVLAIFDKYKAESEG